MDSNAIPVSLQELHNDGFDQDYRRVALFHCLKKYIPAGGLCLDVGCGTSFMLHKLVQNGFKAVTLS